MDKRFRYELAGLQKVQAYKLDRLVMERTALNEKIGAQRDIVSGLDDRIHEHEARLSQLIGEQPLFWIEARQLAGPYIAALRVERSKEQMELNRLMSILDRLTIEMLEMRKAKTLLNRHRARRFGEHISRNARSHDRFIDELVLRTHSMMNRRRQAL